MFPLPFPKGEGLGVGFGCSNNYKNVSNLACYKPHSQPFPYAKRPLKKQKTANYANKTRTFSSQPNGRKKYHKICS